MVWAGLRESLLGPVRRREFELWIHRDGNAAAPVAIEVERPADRSRPDAGLVTLSGRPHWRRKPGLTRFARSPCFMEKSYRPSGAQTLS